MSNRSITGAETSFWFYTPTRLAITDIIKKLDKSAITKAHFLKLPNANIWFT